MYLQLLAGPVGVSQRFAQLVTDDLLSSSHLRCWLAAEGDLPVCNGEHTVWQFNFKGFKLSEDVYASDSIELLKQSGIDFAQVRAQPW
jgi:hypothetical protein